MKYLDLTFDTPQENLACDEALLNLCEAGEEQDILRVWEPRTHFVVLGYSNALRTEVNLTACRTRHIPIFRRCSGGGAVLQGPGCLNFAVVLPIQPDGATATITGTTRWVLQRHQKALQPLLGQPVSLQGSSDLALGTVKFSGNAQRRKRRCVLFHGSLLLDADLLLIEHVLRMPSREPPYRNHRPHTLFLTNLHVPRRAVKATLQQCWGTSGLLDRIPVEGIAALVKTRYATDAWNKRF